ncbi:MAG: PD-(D/E)XK nuclease family protein [Truepera sp.]|nr:PD-(D/E)XK nuclease family protein [Truepera sp.]
MLLLSIEQLVARLAGGFLTPIDSDQLKGAVAAAIAEPLGELDKIKKLPGFQRAAAASLSKAWSARLMLHAEAEAAADVTAKARFDSLAALEKGVLSQVPSNQVRPRDLVAAATKRVGHARAIFGRIEIHGQTEMSPVWRPLLLLIAQHTDVVWVGGAREVPGWLSSADIAVETSPQAEPTVRAVSCASPRHEILEAFRWARQHLAQGALPQQLAITTASPEGWDDHVLALARAAKLPLHFIHGRPLLSTADGQLTAALAEILLRGLSRSRVVRFVDLLRSQCERFESLPGDWWQALPEGAPLLDATRWSSAIAELTPERFADGMDHRPLLAEIIEVLSKGLNKAAEVGEELLDGRSLAVWHRALIEGPPTALDITLSGLRLDDGAEPGAAIVWGPASAIATLPRPFTWLVGLSSRSWPRRAREDPLLAEHIIAAGRLDPLPVHEADRRDFQAISAMTESEVVCSRARRDSEGRLNGMSPLYPHQLGETYLAQSREAEHAASATDRLMARPDEFARLPRAVSALQTWSDWHGERVSGHDGLVRPNHPLLVRALNRRQSATSLTKLLRDPLGYLWTYGFGWREPEETEEPLTLDRLEFGSLLHEILEEAVTQLETAGAGRFAGASPEAIAQAIEQAAEIVAARWGESRPVPPPAVWERKRVEAVELAATALSLSEEPLPDQRSWAEIPFGGVPRAEALSEAARAALPWDPKRTVAIPGTTVCIGGFIDRLDLAGDRSRARVTDYKSGRLHGRPPQLKGGAELQRCLYAFAVKALIETEPEVEARLLYPRSGDQALALEDPEGTLRKLTDYLAAAYTLFREGKALPGPATRDSWYDLAFALPGGAKESYLAKKLPLAAQALDAVAPLWEEP